MKNRIITISREFGSGGRTIGKKVAEMLKIPCYDSELIEKMAQESGFHKEYIKDVNEDNSGGFLSFLPFQPRLRAEQRGLSLENSMQNHH